MFLYFAASEQTGLFTVPLDQRGFCLCVQTEAGVVNNGNGSLILADIFCRTVFAPVIVAEECLIAGHSHGYTRGKLLGLAVDVFQFTGLRINNIDPGVLIVQNTAQIVGSLGCALLCLLFQKEYGKHF